MWFCQSPRRVLRGFLYFGCDSVFLDVKHFVHEMTIRSQRNLVTAWSLWLSQIKVFLNNHLARDLFTPKQQGKQKRREKKLSSAVAQCLNSSVYEISDLVDVELFWKNPQLQVYAVFWTGVGTPIPPTAFESFEKGGSVGNPSLLDDEEDKEKLPPSFPVPKRPNRPAALLRSRTFGTRNKKVPDFIYSTLFQEMLLCIHSVIKWN